jgi:hypothetical protein
MYIFYKITHIMTVMKIQRKTYHIISLLFVFASMLLLSLYSFNSSVAKGTQNPSQNGPTDLPEGPTEPELPQNPLLVVPEISIGTLGLISAFAAAFGMFALMHKRK